MSNISMNFDSLIKDSFPKIFSNQRVSSILQELLQHNYLVVMDRDENFMGILTPADLIANPYEIVGECFTKKNEIFTSDSWVIIADKFNASKSDALPVYNEGSFVGILEKYDCVNDIKQRIEKLKEDKEQSLNLKTFFLKNLSHELRTPLNIMLGFMDLLTELDYEEICEQKDFIVPKIKYSAKKFLDVLADLITLSEIESGKPAILNLTEFTVMELCKDIMEFINILSLYDSKNCNYSTPQELPPLNFLQDRDKIFKVISKILEHACHKSADSRIILDCASPSTDWMHFRVTFYIDNSIDNSAIKDEAEFYAGTNMLLAKEVASHVSGTIELTSFYESSTTTKIAITFSCPARLNS